MKLSVKEEKKQTTEQNTMILKVRYLFAGRQEPPLENEGARAWNARTVPVGKRLARLAAADRDLDPDFVILLAIKRKVRLGKQVVW